MSHTKYIPLPSPEHDAAYARGIYARLHPEHTIPVHMPEPHLIKLRLFGLFMGLLGIVVIFAARFVK